MKSHVTKKPSNSGEDTIKKYLQEVRWQMEHGQVDAALQNCLLAEDIAVALKRKDLLCRVYCSKAKVYMSLNNYEANIEHCNLALTIAKELDNKELWYLTYDSYAALYYTLGQFDTALHYVQLSYPIKQELQNIDGIIEATLFMSAINAAMNNFTVSIQFAKDAFTIAQSHPYPHQHREVSIYIYLANLFAQIGDHESALYYNTMVLGYTDLTLRQKDRLYANLSEIYLLNKEYRKAIHYAQKAIDLETTHKLTWNQIVRKGAAVAHSYLGHYKKSMAIAKELLSWAKKSNADADFCLAYGCLEEIHTFRKEYKEALHFAKLLWSKTQFRLASENLDSINRTTTLHKVRAIQYHMEVEQIKAEQTKKKITLLEKELTTQALTLAQKNEMLLKLRTQTASTMASIKSPKQRLVVEQIQNELQHLLSVDTAWKEFEQRFVQIHSDFSERLNLQFPNLSETEQRICALIKIGLTNKDLASVLCLEVSTVEIYRVNIRKKMKLSKDQNLTTYIHTL
ncbi:MAG: hypothetical protein JNJ85_03745 [Candidatus Kapabacteria bacterium]|nr:hypothetical protein [Candidatus Kapabacteria bacterium]